jgi:predicted nucleic-acid-binding Zn-ribbon protein
MPTNEPEEIVKAGNRLVCPICNNTTFMASKAQLNTKFLSFLGLDGLDKSANVYTCSNCGYLYWFAEV